MSDGFVMAAVLVAAVAHAGWNLLAKAMTDQVVAFWLINVTSATCGAALLLTAGAPARAAWPYVAVSVAIHVAYNTSLLNSYRFGDLGQVYPLARGIAPLLVTGGAAVVAGEGLRTWQLVGVAVIAGGLASLVWFGGHGRVHDRRAVALAVLTGVSIAAYSLADGLGVRHSHSPLGYAGALFLVESLLVVTALVAWRRQLLPAAPDRTWVLGVGGGLLSVGAYIVVLWAQTRIALGTVSALRETSVVAGALLGTIFLHEGSGRRRILAAVVVCVGVGLLVGPATR